MRALPHFEKTNKYISCQRTKEEYWQIYDSFEKFSLNFILYHLKIKQTQAWHKLLYTKCCVSCIAHWQGETLHTLLLVYFIPRAYLLQSFTFISKVKKSVSWVQIWSPRKETNKKKIWYWHHLTGRWLKWDK